jgi:DNA-binding MarR family transcriptional regulator
MSTLVQRQEENGRVRREPDPADPRASLISLTDAGRVESGRVTVMHSILTLDPMEDSPR